METSGPRLWEGCGSRPGRLGDGRAPNVSTPGPAGSFEAALAGEQGWEVKPISEVAWGSVCGHGF